MLTNPTFLAVSFVWFLALVVNAIIEYRAWRRAKRKVRAERLRARVEFVLSPRNVLELRDIAGASEER